MRRHRYIFMTGRYEKAAEWNSCPLKFGETGIGTAGRNDKPWSRQIEKWPENLLHCDRQQDSR
jgi:hypothetical protein